MVRCLVIVGEAAWKLTKSFQQAHPEIPWTLISGMRHRLVHDYGGVDNVTVYRVATSSLPTLVKQVEAILPAETT